MARANLTRTESHIWLFPRRQLRYTFLTPPKHAATIMMGDVHDDINVEAILEDPVSLSINFVE